MESNEDSNKSTREKYRSSCDRCAQSKVRCKKQRPRCHRCQQLGLNCVYGRSRRKGKPASNMRTSLEPPLHSASPSPQIQAEGSQSQLWQLPNSYFADFPLRPAGRNDAVQDEYLNNSLWEQYGTFPIMDSHENAQRPTRNPIPEDYAFMNSRGTAPFPSPPTTNISSVSVGDVTGASATRVPDTNMRDMTGAFTQDYVNGSCISSAFNTLMSLYQLGRANQETGLVPFDSSNSVAHVPSQLSSDRALLTARSAAQMLSSLLLCTCDACASDSNLPFLLATIAAKVLSCYRALYTYNICALRGYSTPTHTQAPARQRRTSPPSTASSATTVHAEGTVFSTPLTIGAFHLPHATKTRMLAQLLLCELQPLAQACNTLGARTRVGEEGRGEGIVCEAFESFLQRGVGELRRSLEAICARIE